MTLRPTRRTATTDRKHPETLQRRTECAYRTRPRLSERGHGALRRGQKRSTMVKRNLYRACYSILSPCDRREVHSGIQQEGA